MKQIRKAQSSTTDHQPPATTILQRDFFARPALTVAPDMIGKFLVRRIGRREIALPITETEAYVGPHDLACHGSKGRTPRTEVMFGPPGHWYVYFIYGIHWMLNAVTGDEGYPAAVLVRGAGDWGGPARLTKALAIDKSFNARPIAPDATLWLEDRGLTIPRHRIRRAPRIGVDYSGPWAAKPYRFLLADPLGPKSK
jgi:DNA-3-methyladenine glycosylase